MCKASHRSCKACVRRLVNVLRRFMRRQRRFMRRLFTHAMIPTWMLMDLMCIHETKERRCVSMRRLFTHAMLSTWMLMDLMSIHKTPLYTRDATLLMHLMLMRRLFTLAMLSTWSLDMRISYRLGHAYHLQACTCVSLSHTHTRDV